MTSLTLAFFTLGPAFFNQVPQDSYALRWMPTKGHTMEITMKINGVEAGGPISVESVIKQTVDSVSKDEYQVTSETLGTLIRLKGEEIRDDRKTKTVVNYLANGAVKEFAGTPEKGESMRIAVASRFVSPPNPTKIGDGWQYTYPAKGDFPGARVSYSLKSVENGLAKVTFVFGTDGRERPYSGSGTWLIDAKTGLWKSLEVKIENWLDQGKAPGTLTMTHN